LDNDIPDGAEYEFSYQNSKFYLRLGSSRDNCLYAVRGEGIWRELGTELNKAVERYKATPCNLEAIMDQYLEKHNVSLSV